MARPRKETRVTGTDELILDAAKKVFRLKGYAGATTADIAKEAGVTHAMLHYYFQTKENIFRLYVERELNSLVKALCPSIEDSSISFGDKVKSIISQHFDFLAEHPELPLFAVTEVISDIENMKTLISGVLATNTPILKLREELSREIASGNIREIDFPDFVADILFLNMCTFLILPALPVLNNIGFEGGRDEFLEKRKKENIEVILSRLRK